MENANHTLSAPPPQSVLVVEDELDCRAVLTDVLAARGYAVHGVANGREALDFLRRHPPPNVILLDLAMPVLDGYAFRRQQLGDRALAAIPVVVLSGNAQVADRHDSLGEVGYLQKPVDVADLCATLERFTVAHRPTVLVVEDEPAIRRMLDLVLRNYGFVVLQAAGGGEAIELFERRRGEVDVVLLDVQMPQIDGPQTLAALRALDARVRAVFMTGCAGHYTHEELQRRGGLHVVPKPFTSMSELARLLWQVTRQ
jgi:CheY-like chemotaxis protein